jgi:hypothetical protein
MPGARGAQAAYFSHFTGCFCRNCDTLRQLATLSFRRHFSIEDSLWLGRSWSAELDPNLVASKPG